MRLTSPLLRAPERFGLVRPHVAAPNRLTGSGHARLCLGQRDGDNLVSRPRNFSVPQRRPFKGVGIDFAHCPATPSSEGIETSLTLVRRDRGSASSQFVVGSACGPPGDRKIEYASASWEGPRRGGQSKGNGVG